MISLILITWLVCFGVYGATRWSYSQIDQKFTSRQLLWFISYYGNQYLPSWITKPLYDCPRCMGSVWGVIASWYFGIDLLTDLIPIILATSGLNYITSRMFPFDEV